MKKNITINLFGQLYHIDEDAYELLKSYQENMHRYFSTKEGGEEISDDIEHRVAELLSELQADGTVAITIEHIQEIIHRIGNPEEIDKDAEDAGEAESQPCPPPPPGNNAAPRANYGATRRLYRDLKDSMLGGVSSGLSHYFGINDPIFIRIAWVLLMFMPYVPSFIIYIILWIVMPPALTAEERLQMYGKPVNPQTLNEEIINAAQPMGSAQDMQQTPSSGHRFIDALLSICAFCFKALLFIILGIFAIMAVFALIALIIFTFGGVGSLIHLSFFDPEIQQVGQIMTKFTWQIWGVVIAGLITLGLPMYALIRRITNKNRPKTKTGTRAAYIVTWLIALAAFIILSISTSLNIQLYIDQLEDEGNTRHGICLKGQSWKFLDEGNWNLVKLENANPRIYEYGKNLFHKDADHKYIRINSSNNNAAMKGLLQRNVEAEAGMYQLEAVVYTDGEGCFLFSQTADSSAVNLTPLPFPKDSLYKIENMKWQEAKRYEYFRNATDSINWEKVQKRSSKYKWCFVVSEPFYHKGGVLQYGITNDTKLTKQPWSGDRYSVYDIVLNNIDDIPQAI